MIFKSLLVSDKLCHAATTCSIAKYEFYISPHSTVAKVSSNCGICKKKALHLILNDRPAGACSLLPADMGSASEADNQCKARLLGNLESACSAHPLGASSFDFWKVHEQLSTRASSAYQQVNTYVLASSASLPRLSCIQRVMTQRE